MRNNSHGKKRASLWSFSGPPLNDSASLTLYTRKRYMTKQAFINKKKKPQEGSLAALIEMMQTLRGTHPSPPSKSQAQGCLWSKKQDWQSLTHYVQEESAETIEALKLAITKERDSTLTRESTEVKHLCSELGDLFYQILFISQIASERDLFTLHDVMDSLLAKMRWRHPHVFAGERAETLSDIAKIWNRQKLLERSDKLHRSPEIPESSFLS